jgi:ankyrin repeat protein
MEDNIKEIKYLNKIIIAHKIYAWLLIILTLVGTLGVILGYSFGSLLVAHTLNELGNAINMYYYSGFIITFLLGIFNLVVAKKLREKNHYSLHLSLLSVGLIVVLQSSYLHYIFAGIILFLWILYAKKIRYIIYIAPLLFVFGLYNIYVNKSIDDFIRAVQYEASSDEIKMMLEQGIDPNIQNDRGMTALFYAEEPSKIRLLLKYGANPNHKDIHNKTPLFGNMIEAKYMKSYVNMLIKAGANINHQDRNGDTVLHIAAYWGRHFSVEPLLENNADISIRNKKGETVLNIAIKKYKEISTATHVSEFNLKRATKVLKLLSVDPKEIKTL